MCFQHFNLFPHLTILENCLGTDLGPGRLGRGRGNGHALSGKVVGTGHEISGTLGGQQQRHCKGLVHDAADHAVR